MFSWSNEFIMHRFHKLGFCSVCFNANLALVGQLFQTLYCASIGGAPISALFIHTSRSQQNAILLLHLFFHSRTESDQVSFNDIFMRLSTQHNLTTRGCINESPTPLVSWNAITCIGPSPLHFYGPMSSLCIGFIN